MTPAQLVRELTSRGETIATCESLTAGLVAATLADVPGASAVLRGGLVTYATELKAHFLDCTVEHLEEQGVVSEATACEMATAAGQECGSTWALGLTGVAGPDLQEGHAPGTVCIGLWHESGFVESETVTGLPGERNEIRSGAITAALSLLGSSLESFSPNREQSD